MIEPFLLLRSAAVLFGAAAAGGLLMAGMRFVGVPRPPSWLAMGHGLLAAGGLTLLGYAAMAYGVPGLAQAALGLLIVAAGGGAVLNLVYHAQHLTLPVPLMLVHAALAATGFALLLVVVLG